ncbi:MAG: cysteine desulfurase family protein [Acidobacteriota bacterium]
MPRYYFDHNATTPVAPEVADAVREAFCEDFGNPSSVHRFGQAAKGRLETARERVALLLHAMPREIVFLSGGTEGDNLAIFGTVRYDSRPRKHVITTAIEHPAVLHSCAQLEREGVEVTRVGVSSDGVVDPDDIRRALRPETVLISVMHANNELGAVQPLAGIGRIAREAGVYFHSDGVQAVGKIRVDVEALGVDLYALSGHKFYAPKGAGALFVRQGVRLGAIQFGGHHERDRRPGTENVPGAVGLAAAAELVRANLPMEMARMGALRDRLEQAILERVPDVTVNGGRAPRTPNTSNLRFDGVDGEAMLIALDLAGFAVSSGAACSSGAIEPSHVLTAIGLSAEEARASLRFSLGRLNTEEQVERLIETVAIAVDSLRKISPVYKSARV